MKNYIKRFIAFLVGCVIIAHVFLFFYSYTNVVTTLILYGVLIFSAFKIFKLLTDNSILKNISLSIIFIFSSLLILDLSLRYFTDQYKSYSEINGIGYYISTYRENKVKATFSTLFNKNFDTDLKRGSDSIMYHKEEFSLPIINNSYGFRGPEPDSTSQNYRILALGDSFTEGIGTTEDSTWIHLLSKKIEKNYKIKTSYFNTGISGCEPFKSYYILTETIKFYHPDLIILLINSSDLLEYIVHGDNKRFNKNFRGPYNLGPWWEPFYASSFVVRAILRKTTDLDHALLSSKEKEIMHRKAEKEIFQLITKKYKPIADSLNSQLAIFSIPLEFEMDLKLYSNFDLLNQKGILYKSFTPEIKSYLSDSTKNQKPIYWKKDLHFNPNGYHLLSELMFKSLNQNEYIIPKNKR